MWYQASPHERVTSENPRFRERLATAYLTMTHTALRLPGNADAHLWTDRRNLRALYMPIGEVEIPHSMIARGPVSVHVAGELEGLIDDKAGVGLRDFRKLNAHPAGENIGLRSDIERLAYTTLYTSPHDRAAGAPEASGELNIHADIDTLESAETARLRNVRLTDDLDDALAKAVMAKKPQFSSLEKADDLDGAESDDLDESEVGDLDGSETDDLDSTGSDDLDREKFDALVDEMEKLMAMKQEIDGLKLPAKPPLLDPNARLALISQPQKSWFRPPLAQPPAARVPSDAKIDPQVIEDLRMGGLSTRDGENDILVVAPQSNAARRIARTIVERLEGQDDPVETFSNLATDYRDDAHSIARYLGSLDGHLPDARPREEQTRILLDYFRLAERIRKLKPALQEKLDGLSAIAGSKTMHRADRAAAKHKARALTRIYARSTQLLENFVNMSTYVAQVEHSSSRGPEKLMKALLGAKAEATTTDSWKGGSLKSKFVLKDDDPGDPHCRKPHV